MKTRIILSVGSFAIGILSILTQRYFIMRPFSFLLPVYFYIFYLLIRKPTCHSIWFALLSPFFPGPIRGILNFPIFNDVFFFYGPVLVYLVWYWKTENTQPLKISKALVPWLGLVLALVSVGAVREWLDSQGQSFLATVLMPIGTAALSLGSIVLVYHFFRVSKDTRVFIYVLFAAVLAMAGSFFYNRLQFGLFLVHHSGYLGAGHIVGAISVTLVPLLFVMSKQATVMRKTMKIAPWVMGAVGALSISEGSVLALAILGLAYIWIHWRVGNRWRLVITGILIVIGALIWLPKMIGTYHLVQEGGLNGWRAVGSGRVGLWMKAFQFLQDPKIFFLGGGSDIFLRLNWRVFGRTHNVHNYFLQLLLDYGIFGFALIMGFYFQAIRLAKKMSQEISEEARRVSTALVYAVSGLGLVGVTTHLDFMHPLYISIWILWGWLAALENPKLMS